MDFVQTLAQMYANQGRPNFQASPSRPTVLPFGFGTKKIGLGDIGKNFGEGVSDAFTKSYIEPRLEAAKKEHMWNNDPDLVLQRIDLTSQRLNTLPPEQKKKVYENPEFQSLMKLGRKFGVPSREISDPETGKTYLLPIGGPTTEQQTAVGVSQLPSGKKPWELGAALSEAQIKQAEAQRQEAEAQRGMAEATEAKTRQALSEAQALEAEGFPEDKAIAEIAKLRAEAEASRGYGRYYGVRADLEPLQVQKELALIQGANKRVDLEGRKIEEREERDRQKVQNLYIKDYEARNTEVDRSLRTSMGMPVDPVTRLKFTLGKLPNLLGLIQGLEDAQTNPRTLTDTTRLISSAYDDLYKVYSTGEDSLPVEEVEVLANSIDEVLDGMILPIYDEAGKVIEYSDLGPDTFAKYTWIEAYKNYLIAKKGQAFYDLRSLPKPQSLEYYKKEGGALPGITRVKRREK